MLHAVEMEVKNGSALQAVALAIAVQPSLILVEGIDDRRSILEQADKLRCGVNYVGGLISTKDLGYEYTTRVMVKRQDLLAMMGMDLRAIIYYNLDPNLDYKFFEAVTSRLRLEPRLIASVSL